MEPVKEGVDQTEKTKVVELTLQEVSDLYKNPDKFKKIIFESISKRRGVFYG